MTGVELITAERERQIKEEHWTPEHDATHTDGSLVMAAISYAAEAADKVVYRYVCTGDRDVCDGHVFTDTWPWEGHDKRTKHTPMRMLVIAGALIAAELDRRLRRGETP